MLSPATYSETRLRIGSLTLAGSSIDSASTQRSIEILEHAANIMLAIVVNNARRRSR